MTRTVYTVTARTGGGSTWTPIGTATVEADGTIAIELDALPAAGRLVLPPDGALPATSARERTRHTRTLSVDGVVEPGDIDTVGLLVGEATLGEATALVAVLGDPARPSALVAHALAIEVNDAGVVTTLTVPLAPLVAEAFAAAKAGAR